MTNAPSGAGDRYYVYRHYAGQNADVSVSQVKAALGEVGRRHKEGQPKIEVPVEKQVVPDTVTKP